MQVTVPWKKRVLAALAANKAAKKSPINVEQLGLRVGAKKGSVNKLLDLEREPPQLTSTYVAEICDLLNVLPPVLENEDDDEEFARDVLLLRELSVEDRRDLMKTASRLPRRKKK